MHYISEYLQFHRVQWPRHWIDFVWNASDLETWHTAYVGCELDYLFSLDQAIHESVLEDLGGALDAPL